ncbi:PREDICTED: methyltransferase-like protein 22 isoform X2 [Nicrophorus vespilloides]|uniref:Methyltransferase-like protein 22 isoform X2 n=1 Tax=Nicrophorus vespilloides TaxID=110193 RepID=A0ABM1N0G6_NICVS|nr:PREDICTED: methyltransferase-like protein 22 isoform X2 [Nicrophorus vespilloides]
MMDGQDYEVSSELYAEFDYGTDIKPTNPNNVVSLFAFKDLPISPKADCDGDLDLVRRKADEYPNNIEIEHSKSTLLGLVGLQIWRGALLLADWLIYNGKSIPDGYVLELGSGVGLTSIVAGIYKPVICTDINIGGLLKLIEGNVARNNSMLNHPVKVAELDFTKDLSDEIVEVLPKVKLIIAADVVYDDRLTDAFVQTVEKLLSKVTDKNLCVLVALEKRFVFTMADCETCAPCYEYFKDRLLEMKNVKLELLPTDFPQYFNYDRVKELVLWKISAQ